MSFDNDAWRSKTLKEIGLEPDELTDEQKDIILQPLEAPENYAHDGELTPDEQFENWRYKLANCGLNPKQISKAYKIITG